MSDSGLSLEAGDDFFSLFHTNDQRCKLHCYIYVLIIDLQGRNGKGVIYVWAAGNGGLNHDSCAADGFSSSIYTISIGSADEYGRQADFDESCSSKMAVTYSYNSYTYPAPSDSWKAYRQVVSGTQPISSTVHVKVTLRLA